MPSHASSSRSKESPARARRSSTSQRARPTPGAGSGDEGSTDTRQRVIAAVGTVPEEVAAFDPYALDVSFNGVQVCRASGVGEDRALVDLSAREVLVEVELSE